MFLNKASKFIVAHASGLAFALAALSAIPVHGAPVETPASGGIANGPPPFAAAGSKRGDADGDGIADALAAKLLSASPGEFFDVIVVFDGPRAAERAREVAGPFQIDREFSLIHGFQARMPAARIWALTNAPGLVRVQENGQVRALDLPSNSDTGVSLARTTHSVDGSGVTVCILDTGINPNHEMFDSIGLTDSDFKDFTPAGILSPYDDQGHGSHVAGILAGDGVGMENVIAPQAAGVAPGVTLKIGKVLDSAGSGADGQVIAGMEWCADTAAASIVSMSLGADPTDGTDALSLAANCLADPDFDTSCGNEQPVIVVVSAGNSGAEQSTVGTPGVAVNAITVGSFAEWSGDPAFPWQDDGVYLNPFSGRGPVIDEAGAPLWIKPDIVGPGSRVLSAYIDNSDPAQQSPDVYAVADGTSMSTPFVAGVIALMLDADVTGKLGVWDQTGPDTRLPHEKVREILALTSVDVGPSGPDNEYGNGLVDALAAVAEALGSPVGATEYPLQAPILASVPNNGVWTHEFSVSQDYVNDKLPIAAHLTIEGQCNNGDWTVFLGNECLAGLSFWDPDLELIVERNTGGANWQQVPADVDPGTGIGEVTISECPARGECWNSVGRVEVVHFIPDVAGDYRMRVWPSADPGTNNGAGGDFSFELSIFDAGPPTNTTPTADFTYLCANLACDFTDASTDDGSVIGWSWNFGDGATSTGQNPSHNYTVSGSYNVTLTVTDDEDATGARSRNVGVTSPPIASFDVSCTDRTCTFTDTSSDDVSIASWSWTFGDGNSSSNQNPIYTYTTDGTRTVSLTVEDGDGLINDASQSVTVTGSPPPPAIEMHVGDLEGAATASGGRWNATATILVVDQNDDPVSGATVAGGWSNGANGGGSCVTSATGVCPITKSNLKNNVLSVTFTVSSVSLTGGTYNAAANTDADDDSTGTVIVVSKDATNQPPTASFTWDCSPTTGTDCIFADASSDNDGSVVGWSWDFGDGVTLTDDPNPSHTYEAAGPYTVVLTATDNSGATNTSSQDITVGAPPPPPPPADIVLSLVATKVKGVKTVDLSWSGTTATNVDIYRDGNLIITTINDGTHSETLGKGGGTYNYQVCEKGTATCSAVVAAVF